MFPFRLRPFVTAFVLLCIVFVPVPFYGFLYAGILPTAFLLGELLPFYGVITVLLVLQILLYAGVFTGVGFLIYRLATRRLQGDVRWVVLAAALLLPFACSSARVLGSSLRGQEGPYSFWEAVDRSLEHRH